MDIRMRYSEDSLFGDYSCMDEVDVPASMKRFGELLAQHIRDVEPDATLDIEPGDSYETVVNGRTDTWDCMWLDDLATRVYEEFEWVITCREQEA